MICLQTLIIDAVLENLILLQTVKSNHKADVVDRVVTVVYFFAFILKLLSTLYEHTDHRQKS